MYNSIFQREWWLDAVAPNKWDVIEIKRDNEIVARWPYVFDKTLMGNRIIQPLLTQTLGPWLKPSKGKYANSISDQKKYLFKFIESFPDFIFFNQSFHYSITNWLPFYWRGFSQSTKYTYVLEDLTSLDLIWNGFKDNIRSDINKATNKFGIKVRFDLSIDDFLDLNEKTFKRQGLNMPYSREFIKNLDNACVLNNARKIFFAVDNANNIHAAVYLVWDDLSAYQLMVGGDPELRNSGATSLCIWESIKFASSVTVKYDFEGSMIESVEKFYSSFGAKQIPYYSITKINSILLLFKNFKTIFFIYLKKRFLYVL